MNNVEKEKITIELPKNIMNFLRVFFQNPEKEYLEHSVFCAIKADLDCGEVFQEDLGGKYGLTKILEEF